MTTTHDSFDIEDVLSVEDGQSGRLDLIAWGLNGERFVVLADLHPYQAWQAHDAIADALRTWPGSYHRTQRTGLRGLTMATNITDMVLDHLRDAGLSIDAGTASRVRTVLVSDDRRERADALLDLLDYLGVIYRAG